MSDGKNGKKTRKDTPVAKNLTVTKKPVSPVKTEEKSPEEEKPKRSLNFNIFRRKTKSSEDDSKKEENSKENNNESKVEWNMSSLLKSTLPNMTRDVVVDEPGLFSFS